MMRCKNKQSFFALHQIQTKIYKINPNIDVEFHILWDTDPTIKEKQDDPMWSHLVDQHIKNIVSYDRNFFKDYVKNAYYYEHTEKFDNWGAPSYHLIMGHYFRRVKLFDYYLIYDDDILLNDDFSLVLSLMLDKIPVMLAEPMNGACDKVLFPQLVELYGEEFTAKYRERNPHTIGFNAGFQGVDLSMYDDFLSVDRFTHMLSMFDMRKPFNDDGTEIWGDERFKLDTQQQSFFGLMNTVMSKKSPHILDLREYFVAPNFGFHPIFGEITQNDGVDGWSVCLKSKISHFIGHTQGKGKPQVFLQKVDEYLMREGFTV